MASALRPRSHGEDGFTLIELLVVMAILAIVLTVVLSVLVQAQKQLAVAASRSQSVNQVRQAVDQITEEIRSGNVFYDPATITTTDPCIGSGTNPCPGYTPPANYGGTGMLLYTQARGTNACVEWQINGSDLQQRSWPPQDPPAAVPWTTVASGVVNTTLSPAVTAFTLDATSDYGNRLVDISMVAQVSGSDTPSYVNSSVAGRDTQYSYPQSVCSTIPAT